MSLKLFVVVGARGFYEDRSTWVVRGFFKEARARRFADHCTASARAALIMWAAAEAEDEHHGYLALNHPRAREILKTVPDPAFNPNEFSDPDKVFYDVLETTLDIDDTSSIFDAVILSTTCHQVMKDDNFQPTRAHVDTLVKALDRVLKNLP